MAVILYALIERRPNEPHFGKPLYIGIGSKLRPYSHFSKARSPKGHPNKELHAAIAAHFALGIEPEVEILAVFTTKDEAANAEIATIMAYGRLGRDTDGILFNVARGGNGPDPTLMNDPEILAKIAAASKAQWSSQEARDEQGRKVTEAHARPDVKARIIERTTKALNEPETRSKHLAALERINAAMTSEMRVKAAAKKSPDGVARSTAALAAARANPRIKAKRAENSREPAKNSWADPVIRAKRVDGMTGKKKTMSPEALAARRANALKSSTPEANALKAAASKARWADPEFRARMAEKRRQSWQDPEKRAHMLSGRSEGISESWKDPETRERRLAGMKAVAGKAVRESEQEPDSST